MSIPKGFTQKEKAKRYIKANLPVGYIRLKTLADKIGVGRPAVRSAIEELRVNRVITVQHGDMAGRNSRWRLEIYKNLDK